MPTVPTPPTDPFDPCRAWLGIDRADLSDPRKVLGLAPGENDPLRVLRAAEARLARLKGLAAGEHHAAREALILRVEQARESVLSGIARAGTKGPPSAPFAMPPPPKAPRSGDADAHVEFAPVADAEPSEVALVRVRGPRPGRRRGSAGIWVSFLAVSASVGIFAAFVWWQGRREADRQAARAAAKAADADRAARDAAAEDRTVAKTDAADRKAKPLPEDAAVSSSPPPRTLPRPSRPPRPRPDDRAADDEPPLGTMAAATDMSDASMPDDPPPPASDATPDSDAVAEDGSMEEESAPGAEDDMAADPVASDDASMDDAAPAAETADDASGADGAVAEALTAIRAGDFDAADAVLASALADAESLAAKRRVADWQVLAQYSREFAGYREKALSEAKSGDEFEVNGKVLAVVENDGKKFIYRWQGRNRTSPRDKIPAGITFAIVSRWFDARPANQLYLGAWHATKPEPDAARARECWQRAEKGGLSAEPLLRLLDDPALAGAGPADAE